MLENGMKVYIVAESRFEWFTIRYVCATKELAESRWKELRDEMLKENLDMIEYDKREGYDPRAWERYNYLLLHTGPWEECHCECDKPVINEWDVISE